MPTTTIALPESYLPWIEKRRAELGIKSKHAFILAAIAALAGVPEVIKPVAVDETLAWPVVDVNCVCPDCRNAAAGRKVAHCGGGERMVIPIAAQKVRQRWICVCGECAAADWQKTPQATGPPTVIIGSTK